MIKSSNNYDLEERTAKFGEEVIKFCQNVKQDLITKPTISQLIRSGTSIGANYMEANGACSKSDFKNKIFICKKESQETKHWLRMIAVSAPENKTDALKLWKEVQELAMIFHKIIASLNKKI